MRQLFFIINSDSQELIHHIHGLGYIYIYIYVYIYIYIYIYYDRSIIEKFCWFHRFYDFYFGFYSSDTTYIYYSTKHFCIHHDVLLQTTFLLTPFAFLILTTIIYQKGIHLGHPTNSLVTTPALSSFILPTTYLFES